MKPIGRWHRRGLEVVLALAMSSCATRQSVRAAPPAVASAAEDFPALNGLCDVKRATIVPDFSKTRPRPPPRVLPRARVFDNLYFLGNDEVSSWAIATDKGIILIDALDNPGEVKEAIEPGLRAFGLNPADIRYVIVTHGHADHYGGAQYLADTYGARIVMSEADWDEVAKPVLQFDRADLPRPPKRDLAVRDGDTVRLGSTTVRLMVARAHTPGTINPLFTVTEGQQRFQVLLWGGMAFNFGPDKERLLSYAAEAERARKLAREAGVEVLLASHSGADASRNRIAAMLAGAGKPNPFVIGGDRVDAVFARMGQCARASAEAARDRN